MMIQAALLKTIQDCGEGVLVLTEGLSRDELLRSRLTRSEVQRQLILMADLLTGLDHEAQAALPEIDWAGWQASVMARGLPEAARDDALWFSVSSLVPATLLWLRVYRESAPALFRWDKPADAHAAR